MLINLADLWLHLVRRSTAWFSTALKFRPGYTISTIERGEDKREQAERTLTIIRVFLSDYKPDNLGYSTEI